MSLDVDTSTALINGDSYPMLVNTSVMNLRGFGILHNYIVTRLQQRPGLNEFQLHSCIDCIPHIVQSVNIFSLGNSFTNLID
jgi:hypothetical protein